MIPIDWATDAFLLLCLCVAGGAFVVSLIAWFYFDDDRCF